MKSLRSQIGFSLVEMMVVCALLAILLVMTVPAVSSLIRSSELQRGAVIVADAVSQARQIATAQHVYTELRFVEIPSDSTRKWKACQIWAANPRGGQFEPASRLNRLPTSACIASKLSPLLASGGIQGTMDVPSEGGSLTYVGVRFGPDGSLEYPLNSSSNFVTLAGTDRSEDTEPPANFIAVQINAYTGKATLHQP